MLNYDQKTISSQELEPYWNKIKNLKSGDLVKLTLYSKSLLYRHKDFLHTEIFLVILNSNNNRFSLSDTDCLVTSLINKRKSLIDFSYHFDKNSGYYINFFNMGDLGKNFKSFPIKDIEIIG